MIRSLKITFEPDTKIIPDHNLASVFHGVMMEKIDSDYAERLHLSRTHPYSQYITGENNRIIWRINTLDKEASEKITEILAGDDFTEAYIKYRDLSLKVSSKEISETSSGELLNKYYLGEKSSRYITIKFLTPTAFKSGGKYMIFPTSKHILNNLAARYDSFAEETTISDDRLSEYISECTDIVEYNLRSVKFSLEGITVPSFIGTVCIRLSGSREFICLMNMLLAYGEYSGTGIKTSLGMGAYKIIQTGGRIR